MPRTDNDSWDLATSVGATATMVAAARAIATKADNPLIQDRFAEPLVRAVGVDFFTRWVDGDLVAADVDDHESGWKLEHMPAAMAARTRFFDTFFRDAAQAGIRQAVILASGLDARLPVGVARRHGGVRDRPARGDRVQGHHPGQAGATPQADLRTVAIDLRRDWPKALLEAGFDNTRPTAWIAEGLFGYLPPDAQDRLLDNISALSAEGSRVAVEAIPHRPQQDLEKAREMMRRATAKWRDHGFELDWEELGFEGERNDVAEYLNNLGWQTVGTMMSELLADSGLAAIPQTNDSVSVADTIYYNSVLGK